MSTSAAVLLFFILLFIGAWTYLNNKKHGIGLFFRFHPCFAFGRRDLFFHALHRRARGLSSGARGFWADAFKNVCDFHAVGHRLYRAAPFMAKRPFFLTREKSFDGGGGDAGRVFRDVFGVLGPAWSPAASVLSPIL